MTRHYAQQQSEDGYLEGRNLLHQEKTAAALKKRS